MANKSGIVSKTGAAPRQILADVQLQSSVGCLVPSSLGSDGVVPAGTPLNLDFTQLETVAAKTPDSSNPMNAVLLHDVEVSTGNGNGTALVFGFVNLNRVASEVVTKIDTAKAIDGATPLITFMKL